MKNQEEEVAKVLYRASRPSATDPYRDHPESWERLKKYYPEHERYWLMMARIAIEAARMWNVEEV